MNKRKILIIIFSLFYLIFLPCLVTVNSLSIEHNVELTKKQAQEICFNGNKKCDFSTNINYLSDDQTVFTDIKENTAYLGAVFGYINFLAAIIILFCCFYGSRKRFKDEDGDNDSKKLAHISDFIIFSSLANYKIINLCLLNIKEMIFGYALGALALGYFLFFLFYFICKFIFKNRSLSILLSTFILGVMILSRNWIAVYEDLKYSNFANIDGIMAANFLVLMIIVIFMFFGKIYIFLKKFAIVLFITCFLNNFYLFIKNQKFPKNKSKQTQTKEVILNLKKDFDKNIYIIVLDMYSGYDILEYIGYKNDLFIKNLKIREFFVFKNINSNYTKTILSLPSVLNFDYADNIEHNTPNAAIDNSLLFTGLKKAGYDVYYFNSYPECIELNKENYANLLNYNSQMIYDFLIQDTLFENFRFPFKNAGFDSVVNFYNDSFLNKNKKIVFVHLLMPHFPYLFDANGNPAAKTDNIKHDGINELYKEGYIEYLKYLNGKILKIIDLIRLKDKNSIIILMGDHGCRLKNSDTDDKELFENEISKNDILLKSNFNTFLAYYNDGFNKQNYENTKTLLTFFRKFSNEIFGTNYKEEDKKFYVYYNQDLSFWDESKYSEVEF